jgi:hypothetical protein
MLALMRSERVGARICASCGSSSWGTRNRCNVCRAKKAREMWQQDLTANRAKDSARHRVWREANPQKVQAQDRRKRYGITAADFEQLLAKQNDECAICGDRTVECVDHCHVTGAVRGLLCRLCNTGLGHFRDDPERLMAAAAYLLRSRAG